jgi:putative MATE family efflux protein
MATVESIDARAPSPRTARLLDAPVVPTLLALAAPNAAVTLFQSGVSVLDAYFVARLGAEAIAGVSLVFPVVMLMQTMSSGGMGGGVSAAVARALGGGRRADADALATHALLIALGFGAAFSAAVLLGGPALYRAMGGRGATLAAALAYSNILFAGAIAAWTFNTLTNVVRGTGHMAMAATLVLGTSLLQLVLSPTLINGWGPFPRLGVRGAAVALVAAFTLGSLVVGSYLVLGRGLVRLRVRVRPRAALFHEILRVGLPGALNTVLTNSTVLLLTGIVGQFGTFALAGYGIGARLEYLQIPLVFGMGAALVAMVGTNVGAGRRRRAERVAWTGAAIAAAATGLMGLWGALFPHAWLGLFTTEPEVLAAGASYLRIVGPVYGFFGVGLALYFASQGAGRLFWPVTASVVRLGVAVGGAWLGGRVLGGGLTVVFAAMAASLVLLGGINMAALGAGAWRGNGGVKMPAKGDPS